MATINEQEKRRVISTNRVGFLGMTLILVGMLGFYTLPGMIAEDASGSKVINAFYCSVITLTTIGFGDICPSDPDIVGRMFLTVFPLMGLGFFCGPILDLASSWRKEVPGGPLSVAIFALGLGVSMLTVLENLSMAEALHFCVVLATTIGYGDITPKSDMGRAMVAIYAVLALNVMGGLLDVGREYLESFCQTTVTTSKPKPAAATTEPTASSKKKTKKRGKNKKTLKIA